MMSHKEFLRTMPEVFVPRLPPRLQVIQSRQPFQWILQFHFGESYLHYEVCRAWGRPGWELGLHFEARDKTLNRYLLLGFRRHLAEIKDNLGESVEAEMWTRGWTKVYDVVEEESLSRRYQERLVDRLVKIVVCFQPIFAELRGNVKQIYR